MAETREQIEATKIVMRAAAEIISDVAFRIIQDDPHQWSMRPCGSCQTVSSLIGRPFGCYDLQRRKP